jgi:hypothetical protein
VHAQVVRWCKQENVWSNMHRWITSYKVEDISSNGKQDLGLVSINPSPNHSRSVGLVLNPRTGLVLPQYHIKQDDFFETATGKPTDFDTLEPIWKRLAGLDQDPTIGKGKTKGKSSKAFPSIRPARETPMQEGIPGPPVQMFNPDDEVGNPHLPDQDPPVPAQQVVPIRHAHQTGPA